MFGSVNKGNFLWDCFHQSQQLKLRLQKKMDLVGGSNAHTAMK